MRLITKLATPVLVFALALPLLAADPAQSLYLGAGKEERAGNIAKAREIYESIIDRFPESEFAVKANDRLLGLQAVRPAPAGAPAPAAPKAAGEEKPLPDDPLLRRGIEAARLKERADVVYREELERLGRMDEAREGRKASRWNLAEREGVRRQAAERKVVAECGFTLEELTSKLAVVCKEAGLKEECREEDLRRLAPSPK